MARHQSVLLEEAVALLPKKEGIYVDLTLGRAGHTIEILKTHPDSKVIAFDVDEQAIEESEKRLALEGLLTRVTIVKANFADARRKLWEMGIGKVDGIIADLGVSSPQFDDPERGFSYRYDAPLDMRMDRDSDYSALDLVNLASLKKLTRIIRDYGEEKDAYRIAEEIVKRRPLETTFDLVEAVKAAKSPRELKKKGHPAKQTFQAIRIAVNGELDSLEKMLDEMPAVLDEGGVMSVISFHSLEDRLVKDAFRSLSILLGNRIDGPVGPSPSYRLLLRKPLVATKEEIEENPRAKSAKLRAIERSRL